MIKRGDVVELDLKRPPNRPFHLQYVGVLTSVFMLTIFPAVVIRLR